MEEISNYGTNPTIHGGDSFRNKCHPNKLPISNVDAIRNDIIYAHVLGTIRQLLQKKLCRTSNNANLFKIEMKQCPFLNFKILMFRDTVFLY